MPDEYYMARALQLARRGRFTTHPNPCVGCVIVRDGQIVGEGFHYRAGEAHAEVHALQMAGDKARGATVYVTLEPCSHYGRTPPCCDALIQAGIKRLVATMADPNHAVSGRGFQRLREAGIAVSQNLMRAEAERQNRGFLKRMRCGLPWVQLKLAASLDGKTAMADGESQWITSVQARRDVQRLRAEAGAILSTSATVLADDPALTVRWHELDSQTQRDYPQDALRQPVRVILDRQRQIRPQTRVIQQPGETWLIHSPPATESSHNWPDGVRQLWVAQHDGGFDLPLLLRELAARQINSLWVEAGASLAGGLLQARLVDEVIIYLAAKLLGHQGRGLCMLPGLEKLADAPQLIFTDVRRVGPDLCLHLRPACAD